MVCQRCVLVVRQELDKIGLQPVSITLGEVELNNPPSEYQVQQLGRQLVSLGFELLDNRRQQQIEKIRHLIIEKVQEGEIPEHFSISDFLSKSLHKEYSWLGRLFSEVEGITLEHYFILQKIEKVKEWLVYDELTISEIAWKLGYSSVAHLSAQFKKMTGMTPSQFKKNGLPHRKPLDHI
jgi:AraC family transcriptional regulator